MPCVGQVNGLGFYVYADDHNPPHVHVFYAELEVLLPGDGCDLRRLIATPADGGRRSVAQ